MSNKIEEIGDRLRTLRKHNGLSQQALAEKAGISYKYLGEIERGQVNLSLEIFMKIAEALNTPAGDILDAEKQESEEMVKAKAILAELPEEELGLAVRILKVLNQEC